MNNVNIDMQYAPVIIPTMCRDMHFSRCIESLKKNQWAKYTDVYVGVDYPPAKKYMDGYTRICQYLREGDFGIFKSFQVVFHQKNIGSFENNDYLIEQIKDRYPYFIRTDDDMEFSINFLEYMNRVLWKYANDENALGVTGYSFPIKWKIANDANVFKMNYFCPMWGTAFYIDKFIKIRSELKDNYFIKEFKYNVEKKGYRELSQPRFLDFVDIGLSNDYTNRLMTYPTDIAIGTYMPLAGSFYILSPTISKVRNWGFDGTGEYCQDNKNNKGVNAGTYNYSAQIIDDEKSFMVCSDDGNHYKKNKALLNKFCGCRCNSIIKRSVKLFLYMLLKDNYYKVLKFLQQRRMNIHE